jgi:type IV pilus assembly protein PilV
MKSTARGFGLIEVLVAALVLAVGLIGLAALQAKGLQIGYSAALYSQATLLAYDIADRMRANHDGFRGGFYHGAGAQDHNCVWDGTTAANCSSQQMAEHDVWEWQKTVKRLLPEAQGTVCRDSTPQDGGDLNADGTVSQGELGCDGLGDSLVVKIWFVDSASLDEETGQPVNVFRRLTTEVRP